MQAARRAAIGLVILGVLTAATSAVGSPAQHAAYPFVKGYHVTGTPFAIAEFDGGTAVGPVVLLAEYNLKGVVPNSYAGLISSSFYVLAKADAKGVIQEVSDWARPGASSFRTVSLAHRAFEKPAAPQVILTTKIVGPLQGLQVGVDLGLPEVRTSLETLKLSSGGTAVATFPLGVPTDLFGFQLYKDAVISGTAYPWLFEAVDGSNRNLIPEPVLTLNLGQVARDLQRAMLMLPATTKPATIVADTKRVNNLIQVGLATHCRSAVAAGELSSGEFGSICSRPIKDEAALHKSLQDWRPEREFTKSALLEYRYVRSDLRIAFGGVQKAEAARATGE